MDLKKLIDSIPELATHVDEQNYEEIATYLNQPQTEKNPVTEVPLVPSPVQHNFELFTIALEDPITSAADQEALERVAGIIKLGEAYSGHLGTSNEGNLPGLIDIAEQNGLSPASVQRLKDRIAQTIPDPSWQAQIKKLSLAEQNELGRISPEDVQELL